MTEIEVTYYFSQLFGVYIMGWSSGYLITFVKNMLSKV